MSKEETQDNDALTKECVRGLIDTIAGAKLMVQEAIEAFHDMSSQVENLELELLDVGGEVNRLSILVGMINEDGDPIL